VPGIGNEAGWIPHNPRSSIRNIRIILLHFSEDVFQNLETGGW
jgi:hypothetical protein